MENCKTEQSIGFLVSEVARLMRRDFDDRVRALGLTLAQWRALANLARFEGCSNVQLADQLEIKPITLTRQIDKLVAAGLVRREADTEDRRVVRLYLTEQAQPVLKIMRDKALETRSKSLSGVNQAEYEQVFAILQRMKENLTTKNRLVS